MPQEVVKPLTLAFLELTLDGYYWKATEGTLCCVDARTRSESTVSIDSEKGRALKGHFPKEEGLLLSAFQIPSTGSF